MDFVQYHMYFVENIIYSVYVVYYLFLLYNMLCMCIIICDVLYIYIA